MIMGLGYYYQTTPIGPPTPIILNAPKSRTSSWILRRGHAWWLIAPFSMYCFVYITSCILIVHGTIRLYSTPNHPAPPPPISYTNRLVVEWKPKIGRVLCEEALFILARWEIHLFLLHFAFPAAFVSSTLFPLWDGQLLGSPGVLFPIWAFSFSANSSLPKFERPSLFFLFFSFPLWSWYGTCISTPFLRHFPLLNIFNLSGNYKNDIFLSQHILLIFFKKKKEKKRYEDESIPDEFTSVGTHTVKILDRLGIRISLINLVSRNHFRKPSAFIFYKTKVKWES